MDLDTLRSLTTALLFLVFLAIVAWAFSAKRKPRFEAAARLPFEEDAARDDNEPRRTTP